MGQIRIMNTQTVITDTTVTITSTFQNQQMIDSVAVDGSEDTNYATKMNAHKNACKSVAPAVTSPPITSAPIGSWVGAKNSVSSVTVTGKNQTVTVPTGNPGTIKFNIDNNDGGNFQYSKNGGAWTTVTNGNTITVANGDKLSVQCTALGASSSCSGTVTDSSTAQVVDNFLLQNTNTT